MSHETHVARGDCERVRPGPIGQPANTLSSLAFVAAGVRMWRVSGRRSPWRPAALATVAAGLGSAAYHGPGGRFGKAVHDLGLVATGALASWASSRRGVGPAPVCLLALAAVVHATSRTGGPLCRPDSWAQGHAAWHLLAAAALAQAAGGSAEL